MAAYPASRPVAQRWFPAPLLLLSALLALGGFFSAALAQTALGDLSGTVTDSSGAAVVGAKVVAVNDATQARRVAQTDTTGAYRIDGLFVGTYTVVVESTGFKRFVQEHVGVTPATLKRVDATLEVGEVQDAVTVSDSAPAIETETPALTTGIPKIAYGDTPLMNESRAGYTFDPLTWVPGSSAGKAIYSFAGNRPSMQQANLEGLQHDQYSLRPPTSAISEVNVILSNAPAEYARPVTMDASFKSGTNRLSGEFMVNFVNPCTDARSTPFSNPTEWPCKTQWRFFPSVGGPVFLPKLYDGRNKTFFFFTLNKNPGTETSVPKTVSEPSLAMQGGDFSNYPTTIIDPTSNLPFAGNVIPSSRISSFAKGVMSTYYGSNYNYVGDAGSYINNATKNGREKSTGKNYAFRIDHNLGANDIFSLSYQRQTANSAQDRILSSNSSNGESRINSQVASVQEGRTVSLSHTHTFSPTIVSQARVGVTRTISRFYQASADLSGTVLGADLMKAWGLDASSAPGLSGSPQFTIANWNFTSNDNENYTYDTRYQFYDNISIHRGAHTIKFGYSGIKLLEDGPANGVYFGNYTFDGTYTNEPWADFLLGLPSSFSRYAGRSIVARRRWEHGAFLQDDWRVTRRLTLYYGLRWSRYTAPYDKNGLYYNFDPSTMSVIVPDAKAKALVSAAWPSDLYPIKTADEAGYPSKLINSHNNWNPRLGFALKLTDRSVLRGGYGVYTGAMRFNELQTTGPFAITESFINELSGTSSTGTLYSMSNLPASAATTSVATINAFSTDYHTPYSQNWNVTWEQEFRRGWGVRATYRGVKSTQLIWARDMNQVMASTTAYSQDRRPYPNLSSLYVYENGANDRYQALMFEVTRPFTSDLYFTAAYTRSWSYTEAAGGAFESDQTASTPEYSYDRARDGGRNAAYPTHDIVANFVYKLPVGANKKYLANANRFVKAIAGGWSLAGTFSWRSGWYFTPTLDGVDVGNIGSTGSRRPNLVSGCDVYANQSTSQWYNPACFVEPAVGQLGNVEVNSLEGPSAWVLNLNPYKEIPLTSLREGAKIRIGANIYNILNHPAYALPDSTINSATAGQITGTDYARGWAHDYSGQRQMVFDVRVVF